MRKHLHRIFGIVWAVAIIAAAWVPGLDASAEMKVDEGFMRALVTLGIARALDAAVSVAQGTEIALQPAGFGINIAPGQALDPINDFLEQFSTLMVMACAAFGVQKVLIDIGSWWPLSVAVSIATLAWAAMRWRSLPMHWLSQALVGLLVLRFLVPVVTLSSDVLFQRVLQRDYQEAKLALDSSTLEMGGRIGPAKPESLVDRIRRLAAQASEFGARLDALTAAANRAAEHVVHLIVVFLLQTLVLPILLGWAFWRLARGVMAGRQAVWQDISRS